MFIFNIYSAACLFFHLCAWFLLFAESVGGLVIFNHFHISFHLMPVVEWYLWIITLQKKKSIYIVKLARSIIN